MYGERGLLVLPFFFFPPPFFLGGAGCLITTVVTCFVRFPFCLFPFFVEVIYMSMLTS